MSGMDFQAKTPEDSRKVYGERRNRLQIVPRHTSGFKGEPLEPWPRPRPRAYGS